MYAWNMLVHKAPSSIAPLSKDCDTDLYIFSMLLFGWIEISETLLFKHATYTDYITMREHNMLKSANLVPGRVSSLVC